MVDAINPRNISEFTHTYTVQIAKIDTKFIGV